LSLAVERNKIPPELIVGAESDNPGFPNLKRLKLHEKFNRGMGPEQRIRNDYFLVKIAYCRKYKCIAPIGRQYKFPVTVAVRPSLPAVVEHTCKINCQLCFRIHNTAPDDGLLGRQRKIPVVKAKRTRLALPGKNVHAGCLSKLPILPKQQARLLKNVNHFHTTTPAGFNIPEPVWMLAPQAVTS
jgi:hypothetical protein